ncbi:MAG: translocation/assembly module TamB [Opitutae bacterium]|nr:translocation/assembly module TamB [Opitutae bacterium]
MALALLAGAAGAFLLRSAAGARWLAARLAAREPRFAGQVAGGSLWNGLRLRDLSWRDGAGRFSLDSFEAAWSLAFWPRPSIRIQRLRADGLQIETTAADSPAPADSAPFRLPVDLSFADIRLRDARARFGATEIVLGEARLDGRLRGSTLDLLDVRWRDFDWRDSSPEIQPPPPPLAWNEALDPSRRSAGELPDLHLPLDVRVQSFDLERAALDFGGETQRIASLRFSADWIGDILTIRRFHLNHERGQVEATGTLRPSGDYPVDLAIRVYSDRLWPPHEWSLDLALSNRLADLAFAAHLAGPWMLDARGEIQPLDPRLPVQASLAWSRLAWPLTNAPVAASESGRLDLRGSLESVAIDAAMDLSGADIPASRWSLHATADLRHLAIDRLAGDVLGGSVRAAGALSWTNGFAWRLDVDGDSLDAARLHPEIPSPLAGRLATAGRWTEDGWQTDVAIDSAIGEWRGYPLAAKGHLSGASADGWRTPDLHVAVRDNAVRIAGSYSTELDLAGELDLRNLAQLLPDAAGSLAGRWSLRGPPERPDATVAAQASDLAWRDLVQIGSVRLEASVAALAFDESRLDLDVVSIAFPARNIAIESLRLDADGTRARHRATLRANGAPATGSFALDGALDGRSLSWTGLLERAAFAVAGIDWTLAEPLPLRWDSEARRFTAAPHRWRHAEAEWQATEPVVIGANGAVQLRLTGFPLDEFHPWLPVDLRLRGFLDASAGVRWAAEAPPQAEASIDLRDAGVHLIVADDMFVDDAPPLDVAFETVALRARLVGTNLSARFDLAAPGLGAARAETAGILSADRECSDWTGQVDVHSLKLDVAQPFLSELRTLSGEVDAALRLSGNPRRPLLHGTLALTNGTVEPAAFPVTLGDIHLQGEFLGDRAEWSGGFRSGAGLATLQGEAGLADAGWRAQLHLVGERLELAYGTLAILQASPDLRLHATPDTLAIKGTIRIPKADIAIQSLPESAVRTSVDAVVVDRPADATPPAGETAPADRLRAIQIDLQLGDQVSLGGRGITGRLAGTLRLRQDGTAAPQAFGELRIEDGRYRAYGQRLQIRQGQLIFAGPFERPNLSIEAIREIPAHSVVAGLRVDGPPDALQSSLFSEPAMPEEDVLAYLVLGRPLGRGEETDSNAMLARAALSLGISRSGGVAASAAERLGIDQFQIDTAGDGDDTQVVVSGMVSSRLQLGYGVGVFVPANTLSLRYRLARDLHLEAVSGLESALDLLYTFRF